MVRRHIRSLVMSTLAEIQALSNRPVPKITDETRPIGDLEGFDSLNSLELAAMLSDHISLDESFNPCVSEDGERALCVREIVDRLAEIVNKRGG